MAATACTTYAQGAVQCGPSHTLSSTDTATAAPAATAYIACASADGVRWLILTLIQPAARLVWPGDVVGLCCHMVWYGMVALSRQCLGTQSVGRIWCAALLHPWLGSWLNWWVFTGLFLATTRLCVLHTGCSFMLAVAHHKRWFQLVFTQYAMSAMWLSAQI